jgi:hypothetical protein
MDVVEWSRALDVRLSEWFCSVSMVLVQIPSREEQKFDSWGDLRCSGWVSSSWSTIVTLRVTVKWHQNHLTWKSCWTPVCVNKYKHLRSPPVFCGVRVARSLVFCVVFCRSLFVLLYFFDLRILITPLVS